VAPPDGKSGDAEDRAFDRVKQCLNGGPRIPLDPGSSKMLLLLLAGEFERPSGRVVVIDLDTGTSRLAEGAEISSRLGLGARGVEAEITRTTFVVHFSSRRSGRPSSYVRSNAPSMVSELMTLANLQMVTRSIVVGLPAGHVSVVGGKVLPEFPVPSYPAWSYGPKLVWIVHDTDTVRLVVRPGPEPWRHPWSNEPPVDGPFALPLELPPWTPEGTVFASFEEPMACPHCGSTSSRYRQIEDDFLVCPRCARSFPRGAKHGRPFRPA
jgi:hypothetical protein